MTGNDGIAASARAIVDVAVAIAACAVASIAATGGSDAGRFRCNTCLGPLCCTMLSNHRTVRLARFRPLKHPLSIPVMTGSCRTAYS